ncbi:MAG: hypothetical protein ACOX4U_01590 [Anaerovoracaceae bacterium]
MVDVLKITSTTPIKNKVQSIPGKLPADAVFDMEKPEGISKKSVSDAKGLSGERGQESLLRNLNKEIFEPLLQSTSNQAEGLRKLILMARLFEGANGLLPEKFLDEIFVKVQNMHDELMAREKAATIFSGDFFDSLRMLAKMEGQPKLREAIVLILRYYEGYVNQENSLFSIVKQGKNLANTVGAEDAKLLHQHMETLDTMIKLNSITRQNNIESQRAGGSFDPQSIIKLDGEKQGVIREFLKNEIIPHLGSIAKNHQGSNRIYNQIMSIVHSLVRFDKADPALLENAIFQFGDEFKKLAELSDSDIREMKRSIFENAFREQENALWKGGDKADAESEKTSMASLLARAMDKSGPAKMVGVAQQLLMSLIQSESPVTPLIHFVIPFQYFDENTYGEFFVDKDCKGKGAEGKSTSNIFFTIQSDKYGNFEVDLLVSDKKIDLDIRCPDMLVSDIKGTRNRWSEMMKEQGFSLANYSVASYQESKAIIQRFPRLAVKRVGLDVKV